jgi:DNA-binding response OmpR family regulator
MAFIDGRDLLRSPKEFAVLLLLAQKEGETVNAEYLYQEVWGVSLFNYQTLRNRISELRKKLEDATSGCEIGNVRGEGYCFIQNNNGNNFGTFLFQP